MNSKSAFSTRRLATLAGSLMVGGLMAMSGMVMAADISVTLSGEHEVPPVTTAAHGTGTITINDDMSVSGSVTTTGVKGTMAHIHEAAAGKNGPIIVPLEKKGDNEWVVPANSKLTKEQFDAFKKGDLYVNVHSDAHKGGEIRDQLKP